MVLHDSDYHLVAFLHECLTEGRGHQIESLGGAAGEDDFIGGTGIDETAYGFTRLLVEVGGLLRKEVDPTMDVGIHIEVLLAHGIQYTQGFLCGGRIVEINQRTVVDRAREYGEVLADIC